MTFYGDFLSVLPADANVRRLSTNELDALRTPSMPESLLQLYAAVGVGSFGSGAFWLTLPGELQPVLDVWLTPSPRRIPFARTAFGEVFYFRDLREEAQAQGLRGDEPGALCDVSVVYPDSFEVAVLAMSVEELFETMLGDLTLAEALLRLDLVREATERHGSLHPEEQFGFVPALALGGSADISGVQKVKMLVQTSILRQLG